MENNRSQDGPPSLKHYRTHIGDKTMGYPTNRSSLEAEAREFEQLQISPDSFSRDQALVEQSLQHHAHAQPLTGSRQRMSPVEVSDIHFARVIAMDQRQAGHPHFSDTPVSGVLGQNPSADVFPGSLDPHHSHQHHVNSFPHPPRHQQHFPHSQPPPSLHHRHEPLDHRPYSQAGDNYGPYCHPRDRTEVDRRLSSRYAQSSAYPGHGRLSAPEEGHLVPRASTFATASSPGLGPGPGPGHSPSTPVYQENHRHLQRYGREDYRPGPPESQIDRRFSLPQPPLPSPFRPRSPSPHRGSLGQYGGGGNGSLVDDRPLSSTYSQVHRPPSQHLPHSQEPPHYQQHPQQQQQYSPQPFHRPPSPSFSQGQLEKQGQGSHRLVSGSDALAESHHPDNHRHSFTDASHDRSQHNADPLDLPDRHQALDGADQRQFPQSFPSSTSSSSYPPTFPSHQEYNSQSYPQSHSHHYPPPPPPPHPHPPQHIPVDPSLHSHPFASGPSASPYPHTRAATFHSSIRPPSSISSTPDPTRWPHSERTGVASALSLQDSSYESTHEEDNDSQSSRATDTFSFKFGTQMPTTVDLKSAVESCDALCRFALHFANSTIQDHPAHRHSGLDPNERANLQMIRNMNTTMLLGLSNTSKSFQEKTDGDVEPGAGPPASDRSKNEEEFALRFGSGPPSNEMVHELARAATSIFQLAIRIKAWVSMSPEERELDEEINVIRGKRCLLMDNSTIMPTLDKHGHLHKDWSLVPSTATSKSFHERQKDIEQQRHKAVSLYQHPPPSNQNDSNGFYASADYRQYSNNSTNSNSLDRINKGGSSSSSSQQQHHHYNSDSHPTTFPIQRSKLDPVSLPLTESVPPRPDNAMEIENSQDSQQPKRQSVVIGISTLAISSPASSSRTPLSRSDSGAGQHGAGIDGGRGNNHDGIIPSAESRLTNSVASSGTTSIVVDIKRSEVTPARTPDTPRQKYRKRAKRTQPPGRCLSCDSSDTPEWRRGPDGARTLCNACGLHYAKLLKRQTETMPGPATVTDRNKGRAPSLQAITFPLRRRYRSQSSDPTASQSGSSPGSGSMNTAGPRSGQGAGSGSGSGGAHLFVSEAGQGEPSASGSGSTPGPHSEPVMESRMDEGNMESYPEGSSHHRS